MVEKYQYTMKVCGWAFETSLFTNMIQQGWGEGGNEKKIAIIVGNSCG
jgi:hypothetical protein